VFYRGGPGSKPGFYGDRRGGAAVGDRGMGPGGLCVEKRDPAGVEIPGKIDAGDGVSGGGGARRAGDEVAGAGGEETAGGGRHRSRPAGGGSAAAGEAGVRDDASAHHGGRGGEHGRWILPDPEAGSDHRLAGAAANGKTADRGEAGTCADAGGGDARNAGESGPVGPRTVRGVEGRDSRRPGAGHGAGVLGRAESAPG